MLTSEVLVASIGFAIFSDFNALENDITAYLFVVIVSKLIYFGIMMAILKLFAQKEDAEQTNKFFWLLFIMPLTSIMVLLCFRYITYQMKLTYLMSILWTVCCLGLLFANILVFAIYEYSLKSAKELYELKTIQHQEEQDKKYFEIIEQSNKDMRVFSHDIKNHLTQIRNLNDITAVQEYIDRLYPTIEKFNYTGISKNIVVIVGIFVSCSANSSSETVSNTDKSTTVVTDGNGTTHYYEIITDEDSKVSTTEKENENDNVIEFESTEKIKETKSEAETAVEKTTSKTETTVHTTAQKDTQPATDKDGWVTKWY